MVDRYSQIWGRRVNVAPTTADRVLIGVCAAVWLTLVGMSVAALVALMDLGRGFHETNGNPHPSSVLYAIIIISALIILAAIPMLLRARRATRDGPGARSRGAAARGVSGQPIKAGQAAARTVSGRDADRLTTQRTALPDATVDRVWLRGTLALMSTMGAALLAVSAATYAMAIGHDGFSWTGYVIAGLVTLAMPVIPWQHVRQLRRMLAG